MPALFRDLSAETQRVSLDNEIGYSPRPPAEELFEFEPVPLDVFIKDQAYLAADWMLSPIQYNLVRVIERVYLQDTFNQMGDWFGGYWSVPILMKNLITAEWGKGGGKDSAVRVAAMRVAYLLMCLRSPQRYFGLPEDDSIHILNIAANSGQANLAFFEPLTRMVKRGWFKDRAEPVRGMINYDKHISAISGHSDAETQEGLNIILGIADEIDAFPAKGEMVGQGKRAREASTSAESILNMLKTSASSRFPSNYKRVAISYPRYLGSTIQVLLKEAQDDIAEVGDANSIYYASGPYATWEVNPRITGKEDFESDYRKDPEEAAAKYECRPFRATDTYFRNPVIFRQAMQGDVQPIQVDYQIVETTSETTHAVVRGWEPVFTFAPDFVAVAGARYAMHGDLAIKGDRAGIAMSHVTHWEERTEVAKDETGFEETHASSVPVLRNDFTIAFEADISAIDDATGLVLPREIQIRWARKLCFELIKRGFWIGSFTFDGFQCLSGDTRIPLLDGTSPTMRELEGRKDFWVYSIKEGRAVPGHVTKAWKTGHRDDMVEVVLDNGESIKATEDHRFMLRDGTYRMAGDLVAGDSLMPLYRRSNHKVVAVRRSVSEDVFDLEVEEFHNFATEAGVFVHNSTDSMQILSSHGIKSGLVSTDRDASIWKTLKDVASEARLSMPFSQRLLTELAGLGRFNGKVDHMVGGSKDEADAFACSIVGAISLGGEEDVSGEPIESGGSLFATGPELSSLEFGQGAFDLPFGMRGMNFGDQFYR